MAIEATSQTQLTSSVWLHASIIISLTPSQSQRFRRSMSLHSILHAMILKAKTEADESYHVTYPGCRVSKLANVSGWDHLFARRWILTVGSTVVVEWLFTITGNVCSLIVVSREQCVVVAFSYRNKPLANFKIIMKCQGTMVQSSTFHSYIPRGELIPAPNALSGFLTCIRRSCSRS